VYRFDTLSKVKRLDSYCESRYELFDAVRVDTYRIVTFESRYLLRNVAPLQKIHVQITHFSQRKTAKQN